MGEGPQLLSAFSPAQLACMCASVPVYVFMGVGVGCKLLCACACALGSACPATHVQVRTGICAVHEPADTLPSPSPWSSGSPQKLHAPDLGRTPARPHLTWICHIWLLWLTAMGTTCSRGSTQCRPKVR